MKKIIITIVIGLSLSLAACQLGASVGPAGNGQASALKILAVETFLADITQNIVGDRARVEALVPQGVDPHAFQPTPKDIVRIAESNILILNGSGFEAWAAETLENAGGKRIVVEASAGLTSRQAREGEAAAMSPEEKIESFCAGLSAPASQVSAAPDPAGAVELYPSAEPNLPASELLSLELHAMAHGYAGFMKLHVNQAGEYLLAANGGALAVTDLDGAALAIEETLALDCAGLKQAVLLDLAPGEYLIALNDAPTAETPFIAAPFGAHHLHEQGDPHFWLDPLSVVKYVENIRDALIAADPAGKELYTHNAAAYITQLNDLHGRIEQQVAGIPLARRLIVTNHESFGYFADRYGFTIIGTVIPSVNTEASPSAQQLARLVDHIRASGAIAVFLETGSNPKLAEQIAQETGIRVVSDLYTHSITDVNGNAATYITMMEHNARVIAEALK